MSSDEGDDTGRPQKPPLTRECIICGSAGESAAKLLYQSELWDFYYCPACGHWFQSSYRDSSDAFPVKRKSHERALTLLYQERVQEIESLQNTSAFMERVRKRITLFLAKIYLRLARMKISIPG